MKLLALLLFLLSRNSQAAENLANFTSVSLPELTWSGNDSLSILPPATVSYCKTYEKIIIAPQFQVLYDESFTLEGAKIYFSEGYIREDDRLGLLQNPTNLRVDFNSFTGVLTIRGYAPIETYQELIRTVQYYNINAQTPIKDKEITIVLGDKIYNPDNGHYYTLIQKNDAISWHQARDEAAADNYLGLQGYLVNITSKNENDFIESLIASNSWLGGVDLAEEGIWRWVTGCEAEADSGAGTYFSLQNIPNAGLPVNNSYVNWACEEPNDCCAGEDFLHMIGPDFEYCGEFGEWNDLPAFDGTVKSFIIEYGCGEALLNFKPYTTLNIQRTAPEYGNLQAEACELYTWDGRKLTKSGSYIQTGTAANNCDSLTILQLKIHQSVTTEIIDSSETPYYWEATGLTYDRSGTYESLLSTVNGCDSIVSLQLEIIKPNDYFVPNVFSPNADGKNDYFTIFGNENLQEISFMRIFDRWGNLAFERKNFLPNQPEAGWGGNNDSVEGVYLYVTEIVFKDGTRQKITGSIMLIR